MQATVVDLRYKTKAILKALDRHERVRILYHGKEKGVMIPTHLKSTQSVKDHPFFGMSKRGRKSVSDQIKSLRAGRYHGHAL